MIFRAGSFRLRAIPRLLALNGASFFAPLTNSLTLARGTGSPTFTRATTAMQQDGDGQYNQVSAGEARFQGMRREQNLVTASEDLSSAPWVSTVFGAGVVTSAVYTAGAGTRIIASATSGYAGIMLANTYLPTVAVIGKSVVARIKLVSNTGVNQVVTLYTGGSQVQVTVTPTPQVFATPVRVEGTSYNLQILTGFGGATSMDVTASAVQIADVTGRSNQNPPEYVPSTWNDTGVAGVRYFPYANGNTVANNVVTEAQGAALPRTGKGNYLAEAAATNVALWCRDLTNAAWTKTNITPTLTATGIDGAANSASTLTATAINGTALQAVTLASSARAQSAFVRRRTGTGAISMTTDGGATYTDITAQLSGAFALVQITQGAVTNPSFGFKIATSGDVIDVDFVQNEIRTFATSPILTTTVAVTRNGDVLSYQSAGNFSDTAGTVYAELSISAVGLGLNAAIIGDTTNRGPIVNWGGTDVRQFDGTHYAPGVPPTATKYVSSWSGIIGSLVTAQSSASYVYGGSWGMAAIYIASGGVPPTTIGNVRIWPTQLPNATLRALTL